MLPPIRTRPRLARRVPATRRLPGLALLVLAVAVPGTATAAPQPAELIALPSVYRVEVRVEVRGLRTPGAGRVLALPASDRVVTLVGTAFAVSPAGVMATSAHLVDPGDDQLVEAVAARAAPDGALVGREGVRRWLRDGTTPVGVRTLGVRVWPAYPDAASPRMVPARPARVVRGGVDHTEDVALVRVAGVRGVPALVLRDAASAGTRVTVIGFGSTAPGAPAEPWVRTGTFVGGVDRGDLPVDPLIDSVVVTGDSGGPVLGPDGTVRAMVTSRTRLPDGTRVGRTTPGSAVRAAMERVRIPNDEGPAGRALRRAVAAAGHGDEAAVAAALADARAAFGPITTGPAIAASARERVAAAGDGPARWQLGALSVLFLTAAGVLLARARELDHAAAGHGTKARATAPRSRLP